MFILLMQSVIVEMIVIYQIVIYTSFMSIF